MANAWRRGRNARRMALWVCCLSSYFCAVLPAVSLDDDYKLVFSDGLPWPDDETVLQYSSARKFFVVGEARDAAANLASLRRKLRRALQGALLPWGRWAQLEAAVLAREAELVLSQALAGGKEREAEHVQAVALMSSALHVCLNASQVIECGSPWGGLGVGSCCSIAAALTAALQSPLSLSFEAPAQAARMMRLAQRLTPLGTRAQASTRGDKTKVVLVTTATGSYNRFVLPLLQSARQYLLAGPAYEVSYVVFTDDPARFPRQHGVSIVYRKDLGWPLTAMLRYRSFLDCWHLFAHADFIFSIDVDCLFVAPVGNEILDDTVGTTHADNAYYDGSEVIGAGVSVGNASHLHSPRHWDSLELRGLMWHQAHLIDPPPGAQHLGFAPHTAVYEMRKDSTAAIRPGEASRYFYSGFFGGRRRKVYEMLLFIARNSEADLARGVVARVHDESHVNRYWAQVLKSILCSDVVYQVHQGTDFENLCKASAPPARILTSAYMYPEAAIMEDRALCRAPSRGIVHPPAQTAPAATAEVTSAATAAVAAAAGEETWCPRDHMHPWLWQPFRPEAWSPSQGWSPQVWNSTPMFVPRILNLAKVKDALIQGETVSGQAARARPPVSRWRVWSADMHIGPISDLKQIWRGGGIETEDQSLSAHCSRTRTCARSLRVLTPDNGMTLGEDAPSSAQLAGEASVRQRFYNAYRCDATMLKMDAVVCSHPVAACEIYLPLDLPIILYVTTRFDLGRLHSADALRRWIHGVRAIARPLPCAHNDSSCSASLPVPRGVVIANNEYDAAYVDYFTGVRPQVLPSLCQSTGGAMWAWPPARPVVLLDVCDDTRCPPFRQQAMRKLVAELHHLHRQRSAQGGSRWALGELRQVYAQYSFHDLVQHPAIVLFPYQVSVMSTFERRAMGIPMFAPSLDLITRWHMEYGLVFERRVDWQTAGSRRGSLVPPHPEASADIRDLDPNDERNPSAVRKWLAKSDIYTLPHVVLFDSLEHLIALLESIDLARVSARIREHHSGLEALVHAGWKRVFRELLSARPPQYRAASHSTCQSDSDSLDKDAARGRGHESYEAAMAKFFPDLAPFFTPQRP